MLLDIQGTEPVYLSLDSSASSVGRGSGYDKNVATSKGSTNRFGSLCQRSRQEVVGGLVAAASVLAEQLQEKQFEIRLKTTLVAADNELGSAIHKGSSRSRGVCVKTKRPEERTRDAKRDGEEHPPCTW